MYEQDRESVAARCIVRMCFGCAFIFVVILGMALVMLTEAAW